MRKTKEQAEQTRNELLKAGLKIFSQKGFSSTRLEDIAKEANVTRGALYWHFKNKLELFCEIYEEGFHNLVKKMKASIHTERSALDNLRELLTGLGIDFINDGSSRKFNNLHYSIEWTPDVHKAIDKIRKENNYEFRTILLQLIEDGIKNGEIKEEYHKEVLLKSTFALFVGMVNLILDTSVQIKKEDIEGMFKIFIAGIIR